MPHRHTLIRHQADGLDLKLLAELPSHHIRLRFMDHDLIFVSTKSAAAQICGMDEKIIRLSAAGLTVRDIQNHLLDLYGLKASPDLISRVADAVLAEVREWQGRALDRMYPIVIFDALQGKIRDADSRTMKNKAIYLALGVSRDGLREVLGLWIAENEGAKFWLSVMNDLKNRGVQDILIAVVDGLKGFPEAIAAAFPHSYGSDLPHISED